MLLNRFKPGGGVAFLVEFFRAVYIDYQCLNIVKCDFGTPVLSLELLV